MRHGFLSILARHFGCSRQAIHYWSKRGLPTSSLGAAIRYIENLTPMRSDGSLPADVELAHVSLDPLAILQSFDAMRVEVRAMDSPTLKPQAQAVIKRVLRLLSRERGRFLRSIMRDVQRARSLGYGKPDFFREITDEAVDLDAGDALR